MGDIYHAGEVYAGSVPIDDDPNDVSDKTVRSSEYIKQFEDGRKPYKVLVTAAANQTYEQQLSYINSNLPSDFDNIWMHCALLSGNGLYKSCGKNAYWSTTNSSNGFYIYRFSVGNTPQAKSVRFKIDNSVEYSDLNSSMNSNTLSLIIV